MFKDFAKKLVGDESAVTQGIQRDKNINSFLLSSNSVDGCCNYACRNVTRFVKCLGRNPADYHRSAQHDPTDRYHNGIVILWADHSCAHHTRSGHHPRCHCIPSGWAESIGNPTLTE